VTRRSDNGLTAENVQVHPKPTGGLSHPLKSGFSLTLPNWPLPRLVAEGRRSTRLLPQYARTHPTSPV
jgi:hypothetical protein